MSSVKSNGDSCHSSASVSPNIKLGPASLCHQSGSQLVAGQLRGQLIGGQQGGLAGGGPSSSTQSVLGLHGSTLMKQVGRKMLIVRHGERIDFTFNPSHENWVYKAFTDEGHYKRFNINMPKTLPHRNDGYLAYIGDTPLTEMGYLQAKITGRALKDAGCRPTYVYASPAYRSVQTAVGILKGLGSQEKVHINIEPGLFEWGSWFRPKLPSWISPEELVTYGYPINTGYRSLVNRNDITTSESLTEYYNRSFNVVRKIVEKHPEDCVIALVAHGASLDTCSRQLVGGAPRELQDFYAILNQTPYLAIASVHEEVQASPAPPGDPNHQQRQHSAAPPTGSTMLSQVQAQWGWTLKDPPIHPFQHQGNLAYDWRQLKKHSLFDDKKPSEHNKDGTNKCHKN